MHDPLNRLYRTKIAFLAVVTIVAGLALITFTHWVSKSASAHWLDSWPLKDVGIALFTTGLLGVGLQYFVDEDKELHDTERLKRVLAESAPAMRDAVISGFAFEPADLARVATPDTLDQIVENGLAIRLGDADFARDLYDDLRQQAINMPERLHDLRIAIRLTPLSGSRGAGDTKEDLLAVTVRWEFKVVPVYSSRRFVCLSDAEEFRELDRDTATSTWFFKPKGNLTAADPKAFELVEFTVDGKQRNIRHSVKKDTSQTYTVSVGEQAVTGGKPVDVAYTYRTVTAVANHRLRLRIDQPTRGLSVSLDHSDTELKDVAALDYIASSAKTSVIGASTRNADGITAVNFSGWALPRSGVVFVWS